MEAIMMIASITASVRDCPSASKADELSSF